MDAFRYYAALIVALTVPPAVLMWFIIHPFIRFWRKVGLVWTYAIVTTLVWSGAAGLFLVRKSLLSVEFGTHWPLLVLGVVCTVVAARLRVRLHRHFSNQQLLGVPELAPDRRPQQLVTEGLHARVRHPRYLQFLLGNAGFALIANYLAVYLLLALMVPGLWLVVILEEKELRQRFGPAYDEYSRRVPRFFPRWRSRV